MKKMNFEEYYGEDNTKIIRERFEKLLKVKNGGFIIMGNFDDKKISDAYMNICAHDVIDRVTDTVKDAEKMGLLAVCTCKK